MGKCVTMEPIPLGKGKINRLLYPLVLGLSEAAMQVKLSATASSGRRGQSGPGFRGPGSPWLKLLGQHMPQSQASIKPLGLYKLRAW